MTQNRDKKHLVIFQPSGRRGYINEGKTVKEASVSLGVDIEGVCGEKSICGKCQVIVEEGHFEKYGVVSSRDHVSPMSYTERRFFNIQQERGGYRLACQTMIQGDVVIFVPEASRMGKQVVRKAAREIDVQIKPAVKKYYIELEKATLQDATADWERLSNALQKKFKLDNLMIDYQVLVSLQDVLRDGDWKITVSVWKDKEVIKVEAGLVEKSYGMAIDVGSTTVAGYLCELNSGKLVSTASMMNPQVIYGEDIMSRISYTMTNPNGLALMNKAIIDALNGIIQDAAAQAGIRSHDILDMTLVGNTCMHHIFLNIDPKYIGRAPFAPAIHHSIDVKARDFGLKITQETETSEKVGCPPCLVACPAGVNGQDFLYLTAQGKYDDALELLRVAIPFAGVCGRVCTHPCEVECERGKVDEPLSICYLHRFIADQEMNKGRKRPTLIENIKEDKKVAIIGSGPAGLACAYDLIRRGYAVTVFEAFPEAGGLLRYGIPGYRLPKDVLDNEIGYIKELGVEIKTNNQVKDINTIFEQGYKAVFVATGLWAQQEMEIPKASIGGVIKALDFLKAVNAGEKIEVGQRIAVIGGGNAAVDAARVAKRLGSKEVMIIYRRSRTEMPAIVSEIDEAEHEGIKLNFLSAPIEILAQNGRVSGIRCVRMELGDADESGRRAPLPIKGSEFNLGVDTVIVAIGQKADKSMLTGKFKYTDRDTISVDPITLQTSVEGVFAGGDAISGPSDVISAIASGKMAAISIELYLEGIDLREGRPAPPKKLENIPKDGIGTEPRKVMPLLDMDKRPGFAEVKLGFDEQTAVQESKRCLNCGIYATTHIPDTFETRDIGIKIAPGAFVHVLPIEAGFVGADNVGVLIAETPYNQDSVELIIDIGTNGELVLGNRQKLISTSCATGPAFEGAEIKFGMRATPGAIEKIEINRDTKEVRFKIIGREDWNTVAQDILARGICGSGIIDIVPQLFLAGIIDRTGRFQKNINTPRLRENDGEPEFVIAWAAETSIGQDIVICQSDVRAIQLAKGAMYAGVKIMMRTLGVEKLDKIILAGAFGSYIDKVSAALLGLFPDCALENVYAVGNAAGDGARIALLNVDKRVEADKYAREVEYIELTIVPDFEKIFTQAMWIPHMKERFPHLEHLLIKA